MKFTQRVENATFFTFVLQIKQVTSRSERGRACNSGVVMKRCGETGSLSPRRCAYMSRKAVKGGVGGQKTFRYSYWKLHFVKSARIETVKGCGEHTECVSLWCGWKEGGGEDGGGNWTQLNDHWMLVWQGQHQIRAFYDCWMCYFTYFSSLIVTSVQVMTVRSGGTFNGHQILKFLLETD